MPIMCAARMLEIFSEPKPAASTAMRIRLAQESDLEQLMAIREAVARSCSLDPAAMAGYLPQGISAAPGVDCRPDCGPGRFPSGCILPGHNPTFANCGKCGHPRDTPSAEAEEDTGEGSAEGTGRGIGFLVAQDGGLEWELENIAVLPEFRRRGVGRRAVVSFAARSPLTAGRADLPRSSGPPTDRRSSFIAGSGFE